MRPPIENFFTLEDAILIVVAVVLVVALVRLLIKKGWI